MWGLSAIKESSYTRSAVQYHLTPVSSPSYPSGDMFYLGNLINWTAQSRLSLFTFIKKNIASAKIISPLLKSKNSKKVKQKKIAQLFVLFDGYQKRFNCAYVRRIAWFQIMMLGDDYDENWMIKKGPKNRSFKTRYPNTITSAIDTDYLSKPELRNVCFLERWNEESKSSRCLNTSLQDNLAFLSTPSTVLLNNPAKHQSNQHCPILLTAKRHFWQ